jgi:hypothetical protein
MVKMQAKLVPLYFDTPDDHDFVLQLSKLQQLLSGIAEILEPVPLGQALPDADAVLLPQILGDAYRRVKEVRALPLPILVLTSEYGTMSMFDLDILGYLRREGVSVIAPYTLAGTTATCRALAAKRELREGRFLVYRDSPGEGPFQPELFKKNYWYQDECAERLSNKFGVNTDVRSFKDLGARAKEISDVQARAEWERLQEAVPVSGLSGGAVLAAMKLYMAVSDDLDEAGDVLAAGINCLNESNFADTTPCLAWNLLFMERGLMWGCESDLLSMITEFIVHRSLRVPVVMSNLYPFLIGQAALKHERIPDFPAVDHPENYVLMAHCGYLGVVPQSFATEWTLRPKVLAIVDDNASAIDARLPVGDLTLSKIDPTFDRLVVVEGELAGYAGWPGSDCCNGAVIRVPDGHALLEGAPACHAVISTGHDLPGFKLLCEVFGLDLELLDGRHAGQPLAQTIA